MTTPMSITPSNNFLTYFFDPRETTSMFHSRYFKIFAGIVACFVGYFLSMGISAVLPVLMEIDIYTGINYKLIPLCDNYTDKTSDIFRLRCDHSASFSFNDSVYKYFLGPLFGCTVLMIIFVFYLICCHVNNSPNYAKKIMIITLFLGINYFLGIVFGLVFNIFIGYEPHTGYKYDQLDMCNSYNLTLVTYYEYTQDCPTAWCSFDNLGGIWLRCPIVGNILSIPLICIVWFIICLCKSCIQFRTNINTDTNINTNNDTNNDNVELGKDSSDISDSADPDIFTY